MANIEDLKCEAYPLSTTGSNCNDRILQQTMIEDYAANFTCLKELIAELNTRIDLLGNSGGGGGTTISNLCGPVGSLSGDTSGYSTCAVDVEVSLSMSGTNGDNNPGANAVATGDVVVYCNGTEVARQPYTLSQSNIANNLNYSDSQTLNFSGLNCVGNITLADETGQLSLPGAGSFTNNACINASCSL